MIPSKSMSKTIQRMSGRERGERRKKMADMVRAGKGSPFVARHFGVSLETVRRACLEFGVVAVIGRAAGKQRPARTPSAATINPCLNWNGRKGVNR